jgi:hypothetical protein
MDQETEHFFTQKEGTLSISAAEVQAKLQPFGETGTGNSSVRDEITALRAQRDSGELTETEWSTRVSELLGAVEAAPLATGRPLNAW